MANRDIAGLLTGIPSGGIDPRTQMSGRDMLVQSALAGQQRMAGGLRGMFNGGPTIQQQLVTAAGEKQKADEAREAVKYTSLADSLTTAGYGSLAEQVKLGDADAYKRGLELITPEKGKTSIEDLMDPETGITHKVLLSPEGNVLRTVGVGKMPELKKDTLPNGKIVWENTITGDRSEPQDTLEAAEQERLRIEKLNSDLGAVDSVLVTITEAEELAEDRTTGAYFNLANVPWETQARKLAGKITTLQATLAFDRLQKMRDESKTGGALGQVSNIELQLLQSSLTALDPISGEEEFKNQLAKVQKHYSNFKNSLLGKPLDIDWSRPEYKGRTTVVDGIRYIVDPLDSTKVFAVGKEQ